MSYSKSIEDFKNIDFEETNEQEEKILEFCTTLKTTKEIFDYLNIDDDFDSFQMTIDEMVDYGLLLERFPNKPDHPKQKYKRNRSVKEETKQTRRVLELINRFNNGEKICIEGLQKAAQDAYDYNGSELDKLWFNESTKNKLGIPQPMSEKSIRRDLDIIKSHFPRAFELITTEKGCYKSLGKKMFDNFLNPEALSLMIQTFNIAQRSNMFDSFDISEEDKAILNKKAKEKSKIYEFKNRPFEHTPKDMKKFHVIEESIKDRKTLYFEYKEMSGKIVKIEVKPYKILFMNDNFYVGCAVDNEFLYSIYRVSRILDIKEIGRRFTHNPKIDQFIKDSQTPFSQYSENYKSNMFDVVLEVHQKKAFYFRSKNYLSSQEIIEEKENGNLLVKYSVTQEIEVEELIKKWIPYVKVIEPLSLKNSIENDLKEYLKV